MYDLNYKKHEEVAPMDLLVIEGRIKELKAQGWEWVSVRPADETGKVVLAYRKEEHGK
jgi:hypothetical protein